MTQRWAHCGKRVLHDFREKLHNSQKEEECVSACYSTKQDTPTKEHR